MNRNTTYINTGEELNIINGKDWLMESLMFNWEQPMIKYLFNTKI